MKKRKHSSLIPLIILGGVSIFSAVYLAQAADRSIIYSSDTPVRTTMMIKSAKTVFTTIDGTVDGIGETWLRIKTGERTTAVRLTSSTQWYQGNTLNNDDRAKVNDPIKVRVKSVNKGPWEATAVKVIKQVSPTPEISNN